MYNISMGNFTLQSLVIFARAENNPSLRSSCPLHLYYWQPGYTFPSHIMLHNVCFQPILYTFLYINDVKKRIHVLAKPQRSTLRIHLCASERSERAIFGVFNSFTVKNVSFFTINVKSYLQKVGGGGMFVQAIPPHPKKWEGYIPHPPGIYASAPPPPRAESIRHPFKQDWVIYTVKGY